MPAPIASDEGPATRIIGSIPAHTVIHVAAAATRICSAVVVAAAIVRAAATVVRAAAVIATSNRLSVVTLVNHVVGFCVIRACIIVLAAIIAAIVVRRCERSADKRTGGEPGTNAGPAPTAAPAPPSAPTPANIFDATRGRVLNRESAADGRC